MLLKMNDIDEYKNWLINIIIHDKNHNHKGSNHDILIDKIKQCRYNFEIYKYEQEVDSWYE